jgi:uncharacterized membrane protein YjjP (DUF1212 family)
MNQKQKEYLVWIIKVSGVGASSPFLYKLVSGDLFESASIFFYNLIFLIFGVILLYIGLNALGRFS